MAFLAIFWFCDYFFLIVAIWGLWPLTIFTYTVYMKFVFRLYVATQTLYHFEGKIIIHQVVILFFYMQDSIAERLKAYTL